MRPADFELVALGVAAEVVVVVEQEDAGLWRRLAVEPGGGESAHAGAHDHQIVDRLGGVDDGAPLGLAVEREGVRGFERPAMAAAQAGERGWVGARRHRCRGRGGGQAPSVARGEEPEAHHRGAMEEIASCDGPVHA